MKTPELTEVTRSAGKTVTRRIDPDKDSAVTPAVMSMRTYSEWEKLVWELEKILKEHGVNVPPKSPFEEAALTLTEMEYLRQNPGAYDCTKDSREKWRRALSLADLAEKIVLVRDHLDFPQLVPHLRLLGRASDLSQFSFTARENQDNNKTFELYLAAMGLHVMTGCMVDNPEQSKGDNPDIMGHFNGKLWALACKAMHSVNPKAFMDRVEEGVKQIQRSAAERGIVVVNMKNTVNHDALWPAVVQNGEYYHLSFPDLDAAHQPITEEFKKLQARLFSLLGDERAFYRHLFLGKRASPHILLVYSTVTGLQNSAGPVFTMLKTMKGLYGCIDHDTEDLANRLNNCLHNCPDLPPVPGIEQK